MLNKFRPKSRQQPDADRPSRPAPQPSQTSTTGTPSLLVAPPLGGSRSQSSPHLSSSVRTSAEPTATVATSPRASPTSSGSARSGGSRPSIEPTQLRESAALSPREGGRHLERSPRQPLPRSKSPRRAPGEQVYRFGGGAGAGGLGGGGGARPTASAGSASMGPSSGRTMAEASRTFATMSRVEVPPAELKLETLKKFIAKLSTPEIVQKVGIFRLAGNRQEVRQILEGISTDTLSFDGKNAHSIAMAFKRYLRLSPTPLIPFDMYTPLINIQQTAKPSERLSDLRNYFNEHLPAANRDMIDVVIPFLHHVVRVEENQMDFGNVAKMFAPSLLRPKPTELMLDLNAMSSEMSLTKDMVNWYDYLFLNSEINLSQEDKAWQKKRNRRTLQLMATAEAPEKFMILNNTRKLTVSSYEGLPPSPPSRVEDEESPSVESEESSSTSTSPQSSATPASSSEEATQTQAHLSPRPAVSPRPVVSPRQSSQSPRLQPPLRPRSEQSLSPRPESDPTASTAQPQPATTASAGTDQSLSETPSAPVSSSSSSVAPERQMHISSSGFAGSTFKINWGEVTIKRRYADFRTLRYFLVKNYTHIDFPKLPKPPKAGSRIGGLDRTANMRFEKGLEIFLIFVVEQDELWMDSLFTKRWLQFIGQTKKDKADRHRERKIRNW
eukprot:CAMPEP_0177632652 /NCGR_PEP_ID=MMETSP0447-20121125/2416_1 /TAXON_ID=0 /ORGANISM="Stygamoeba regulata, Strain BSH-02190019" /LENGTH=667 /DNA_ID=CAMNT_0019134255 /DNA_START=153 /DNA_END=2154 /DNA_ORIENTATION=+